MRQALVRLTAASQPGLAERLLQRSLLYRLCTAGLSPPRRRSVRAAAPGPIFHEANPLEPEALQSDFSSLPDPQAARSQHERLEREGWIERGLRWQVNPWLIRSILLFPRGAADSLVASPESHETMPYEWQVCAGLLAEMHAACLGAKTQLVVLAIPAAHLVSPRWVNFHAALGCDVDPEMTSTRVVNQWLADTGKDLSVVVVDPLDSFRSRERAGGGLYFPTDDHMTAQGHRLLGQSLADALAPMLDQPAHPPR
jgi:hypothetical protein